VGGDSPSTSPMSKQQTANTPAFLKEDPIGSLISGATGAATAFGNWFTTTAKEKAPDLYEKTAKISQDVFSKTKVVAGEALEKTVTYTKKASFAVEQFVEKQLEEHGVVPKKGEETQRDNPPENAVKQPGMVQQPLAE
jgi:hypothetical protein